MLPLSDDSNGKFAGSSLWVNANNHSPQLKISNHDFGNCQHVCPSGNFGIHERNAFVRILKLFARKNLKTDPITTIQWQPRCPDAHLNNPDISLFEIERPSEGGNVDVVK